MRTTVNLDDDVLAALRERAELADRPVGAVASDLLRGPLGLTPPAEPLRRNGFPLLPSRGVTVTDELVNRLRAEAD